MFNKAILLDILHFAAPLASIALTGLTLWRACQTKALADHIRDKMDERTK